MSIGTELFLIDVLEQAITNNPEYSTDRIQCVVTIVNGKVTIQEIEER
jgi:hypothetical protein